VQRLLENLKSAFLRIFNQTGYSYFAMQDLNQNRLNIAVNGFINYCDKNQKFFSKGKSIFEWNSNKSPEKIISLHSNYIDLFLNKFPLYQRLTRSHIQNVIPVHKNKLLAFLAGRIYYIDTKEKKIIHFCKLRGSQPLHMATINNTVYYGEYIRSRNKPPIHLLRSKPPYNIWKEVKKFENIRHIHGVFKDPYNDTLWVTTGDDDDESWIMNLRRSDYKVIYKIGGSQSFRAVTLLFTDDYIYYGTDTPREQNYICRFKRNTKKIEKLTTVGGSIFFGTKVSENLYFSTASEPGKFNRNDATEIWESRDGRNWNLIFELKKDFWHQKLFRYGLIFFPYGPGDGQNLWFSSIATKNEFRIYNYPIV